MTTFLILQKLLIVFNSTLFISKKLQNDNNAHKMIFSDKVCLVVKKLIKTGLKGHQMTIKYKILI